MSHRNFLLAFFALVLLVTATVAFAQDNDPPYTVVDAFGEEVVIEDISRIVTIGGAVTEIVYELGLGDNIIAVDTSSIYPDAATEKPDVGYLRFLSAEPILSFEPTLIITTDDAGPPETLQLLGEVGVTVLVTPAENTVQGAEDKIRISRDGRLEALSTDNFHDGLLGLGDGAIGVAAEDGPGTAWVDHPAAREVVREASRNLLGEFEDKRLEDRELMAVVTVIFDYETTSVEERMMRIRHEYEGLVASNIHSHVGGHFCMELFVLEGRLEEISTFVGRIRATKDTLSVDYSVMPVDEFGRADAE